MSEPPSPAAAAVEAVAPVAPVSQDGTLEEYFKGDGPHEGVLGSIVDLYKVHIEASKGKWHKGGNDVDFNIIDKLREYFATAYYFYQGHQDKLTDLPSRFDDIKSLNESYTTHRASASLFYPDNSAINILNLLEDFITYDMPIYIKAASLDPIEMMKILIGKIEKDDSFGCHDVPAHLIVLHHICEDYIENWKAENGEKLSVQALMKNKLSKSVWKNYPFYYPTARLEYDEDFGVPGVPNKKAAEDEAARVAAAAAAEAAAKAAEDEAARVAAEAKAAPSESRWIKVKDADGDIWYRPESGGETSWVLPEGGIIVGEEDESANPANVRPEGPVPTASENPEKTPVEGRPGWFKVGPDSEGDYWYESPEGDNMWELPPEAPAAEAPANGPVAGTMESVGASSEEQKAGQNAVNSLLKNTTGPPNPVVASITAAAAARDVGATVEEQAAAAAGASAETHVEGLGSNHTTTLKGAEGAAKGVLAGDPSAKPGEAVELAETATRLAEGYKSAAAESPVPEPPTFSKEQMAEINADVNKVFKEKLILRATELVENGVADTDAKPGWVVAVNALNLRGLRGEPDTNKDTYYFYRHRGTGDTRDAAPTAKNMGPQYTYRPGSPRQLVPGHGALEGRVRFNRRGGSRKKRTKSKPKSKSRATRKRGSKSRRRK